MAKWVFDSLLLLLIIYATVVKIQPFCRFDDRKRSDRKRAGAESKFVNRHNTSSSVKWMVGWSD